MSTFFYLLVGHALCDYPLQGDFLARGKDRNTAPFGPGWWVHCLTAHALIQGGMVAAVTGSVDLGIAEIVLHWLIDFCKCEGWFGLNTDQALHVLCKVAWASALAVPF